MICDWAIPSSVQALVLDKASFDMILGPLEELNKRGRDRRVEGCKVEVVETAMDFIYPGNVGS